MVEKSRQRNENRNTADLHLHTTGSDGTDSVEETIKLAKERGLNVIAITDHDKVHQELEFRAKTINEIEVINASEIKADIEGVKIEILSYFLDTSDQNLIDLTEKIEQYRIDRMKGMVDRVNQAVEPEITFEDVREKASQTIARPHLARVLVDKEVVDTISQAFNEYIAEYKPCYVETKKLTAKEVIEAVHQNGGVTSLAHPGRDLPEDKREELVKKMVDLGLDAVEVKYPYDLIEQANSITVNFKHEKSELLRSKFDLLKTGGSDSHGSQSGKDFLGEINLDYKHVKKLKELSSEVEP